MKFTRKFLSAGSVVTFLVLFLFTLSAFGQADERFELPVGKSLHKGPIDAPVVLYEFLDFQ